MSDLARKLREVISNPELQTRLSDAAHDFVHARFSRRASVQQMTEIYEMLLAKRGGQRKRSST